MHSTQILFSNDLLCRYPHTVPPPQKKKNWAFFRAATI